MNNLKEQQQELDKKKYYSSLTARTDMSGKMEFCKDCLFKGEMPSCVIDHETREQFSVCARQYFKLEKEKQNDTKHNAMQQKKIRKRNNG